MHSFDPFNIFGNAKTLRFVIKNIELWNRANSFHSNQSVDNELDLATWLGVGQDQGCEIRRSSKLGWSTRHLIFNTFEFLLPIKIFTTAAAPIMALLLIVHTVRFSRFSSPKIRILGPPFRQGQIVKIWIFNFTDLSRIFCFMIVQGVQAKLKFKSEFILEFWNIAQHTNHYPNVFNSKSSLFWVCLCSENPIS